jgi:Uma2 family endonuclease
MAAKGCRPTVQAFSGSITGVGRQPCADVCVTISQEDNNMSSVLKPNRLTHEEYFALEQAEDQRYEYIAGEVFAMAGGSENHALIGASIIIGLGNALRGKPCRIYTADMKLYVRKYDKFCYPDVQVLCENGIGHKKYVENPILIVEVLSDSTESYDRGLKFEQYRSIETLKYYLLVDQSRKHVDLYEQKSDQSWLLTSPQDCIVLPSMEIKLEVDEIYRQVEFMPIAEA